MPSKRPASGGGSGASTKRTRSTKAQATAEVPKDLKIVDSKEEAEIAAAKSRSIVCSLDPFS